MVRFEKGQTCSIYWGSEENPIGCANVEYIGKKRAGGYKMESCTYGWIYILSEDQKTITTPRGEEFPVAWFTAV